MIKTVIISIIALILIAGSTVAEDLSEYYFRFQIESRQELETLTRIISIDNVIADTVYAYANDLELASFIKLDYEYTILPHPSSLYDPIMGTTKRALADWDVYPTYDAYVAMMYQFAADYPAICQVQSIGLSVNGRELLFAKISDNIGTEENEPEVMYTSTMHGDETVGYILCLRLIDSLLVSYGSDPRITDMINNMEIWINPLANPDGTYWSGDYTVSGARRYNANFVDLNRNFPDPEDGPHPDNNAWQVETELMMALAEQQNFIISGNMHGGAEVINYPWDTWYRRHADDDWWQDVCRQYADTVHAFSPSTYLDGFDDGITNGYDWYTIAGGRQDYMNFWHHCREITMELSNTKLLPESLLDDHWIYNRISLLNYLEQARYGIKGIVTDLQTDLPVAALVAVVGHDLDSSQVRTDPDVGDYHRMIAAGTYDLEFSADGYISQTIPSVAVVDGGVTVVDVQMMSMTSVPDVQFVNHDANSVFPGYDASMNITLTNIGAGDATGVSAVLLSSSSDIDITQSTTSFPYITASGGIAVSTIPFEFSVFSSATISQVVDFSILVTADGGYEDSLIFSLIVGQEVENYETGDFSSYEWLFEGDANWTVDNSKAYEGSFSARSGLITHDQTSGMQITLEDRQAGTISFYYRVSSEEGWDYLRFFINGEQIDLFSGEIDWTFVSYPVLAGSHTFLWQYTKDGASSAGDDAARIDNIVFPFINGNSCCIGSRGNVNGDAEDNLDISDLTALVSFLFDSGPEPPCTEEADINASGGEQPVDITDITYLVDYMFLGGPEPSPCP